SMLDHVKTTATQAFQIWLETDMATLGWKDGPITLSGFVEPFDTWADMTHLVGRERWPHVPRSIAYFCSVLSRSDVPDDRTTPAKAPHRRGRVGRDAGPFPDEQIGKLWPGAVWPAGPFRWDILVDPRDGAAPSVGRERFASQYWTAKVNPRTATSSLSPE